MVKKPLIILILLAFVMLACTLSTPTFRTRRDGEILWQEGSLTLYRCGPDKVDICFDDGIGVTKVYIGVN